LKPSFEQKAAKRFEQQGRKGFLQKATKEGLLVTKAKPKTSILLSFAWFESPRGAGGYLV